MLSSIFTIPFDRVFSDDEVYLIAQSLFNIKPENVFIRRTEHDWSGVNENTLLICTVIGDWRENGIFPSLVDIGQKDGYFDVNAEYETVEKICELLQCRALIGTGEFQGHTFIEISGINKRRKVWVDDDAMTIIVYRDEQQ